MTDATAQAWALIEEMAAHNKSNPSLKREGWTYSMQMSIGPSWQEQAAAILAAREAEPQGWRDIDSAPRDGMIVGFADEMIRLVMWECGQWVQVGATIEAGWFEPTHWQPLPTPPVQP